MTVSAQSYPVRRICLLLVLSILFNAYLGLRIYEASQHDDITGELLQGLQQCSADVADAERDVNHNAAVANACMSRLARFEHRL